MILRRLFGRSWKKYYGVYLSMRNSSWGEISMDILERRPMGMLEHMEVLGLGRRTVEDWHF